MKYWQLARRRNSNIIKESTLSKSQPSMPQSMKEAATCQMSMTLIFGTKSFRMIN